MRLGVGTSQHCGGERDNVDLGSTFCNCIGIAVKFLLDLGHLHAVGQRQRLGIDLAAANHPGRLAGIAQRRPACRNDAHLAAAHRADQRKHLVDAGNQCRPQHQYTAVLIGLQ